MTYEQFILRLLDAMGLAQADLDLTSTIPACIDYAEGRCYRDLDLLATVVSDQTTVLLANTRTVTLPIPAAGTYDVLDQVNMIESGSKTPLTPISREVLDYIWPSSTSSAVTDRPRQFVVATDTTILVGPVSGASVTLEFVGRVKPTPLSATNTTTFLTQQLPDLFLASAMIYMARYMPIKDTAPYEAEYQKLMVSADSYSSRQEFSAASWTSRRVEPSAIPQRG